MKQPNVILKFKKPLKGVQRVNLWLIKKIIKKRRITKMKNSIHNISIFLPPLATVFKTTSKIFHTFITIYSTVSIITFTNVGINLVMTTSMLARIRCTFIDIWVIRSDKFSSNSKKKCKTKNPNFISQLKCLLFQLKKRLYDVAFSQTFYKPPDN